jgi:signal transduction histidine kinase
MVMANERERPQEIGGQEHAILASLSDGLVVSDTEGLSTFVNRSAARLLGVDPEAALGLPTYDLFASFPVQGPLGIADTLRNVSNDPYTYSQTEGAVEVNIEVDGEVVSAHVSPVLTAAGEFLGTVISLRTSLHSEIGRQTDRLVEDISHELRAPLTAIRGYSEMLLRHASDRLEERETHFLQVIQRNSDRLVALVNDVLDLNRIQNEQMELDVRPVHLETIMRDVADVIQPECDMRGLYLTVEIDPNVGPVLGDKEKLYQIMTNLTRNAFRHTPEGGGISLALSCAEDQVQVHVADTGVGIPPEDKPKVFQLFFRMDTPTVSEFATTGLELAIAKRLIEMHDGRIWVESEPRQGTAFTFVLPLHTEELAEPEAQEIGLAEVIDSSDNGRTVLVVEDDRDVAVLIALQLRQEGFEVVTAERGEEALRLAESEEIDLITLDIMLPDTTGLDVLRRLKANPDTANIPVIIVSVLQPDMDDADLGAADHITKPFALERLIGSIRSALATQ